MFNLFKKKVRHKDLKEVRKLLEDHLSQLIKAKDKIPPDIFDVTKFFLEEDLDLYKSMEILMQKNHFYGCISISRTILENSINLQYIYKNETEKRAKNFKLASAKDFLKRVGVVNDGTLKYKEVMRLFEERMKDYIPDRKSIKDKAEEIGSESIYKDAYKRLSGYVHSEYKGNRQFDEIRPYTAYLKRIVFSDTLLVTLEALKNVCERYDLDGGVIKIDDSSYKGIIFFATNPKKEEIKLKDFHAKW